MAKDFRFRNYIKDKILVDIKNERFDSWILPSIRILADRYSASSYTIYNALHMLSDENIIKKTGNNKYMISNPEIFKERDIDQRPDPGLIGLVRGSIPSDEGKFDGTPEGYEEYLVDILASKAREYNKKLLFLWTTKPDDIPKVIKQNRINQLMIYGSFTEQLLYYFDLFRQNVVCLELMAPSEKYPSILTDNSKAARFLAGKYLSSGCNYFIFVTIKTHTRYAQKIRGQSFVDELVDKGVDKKAIIEVFLDPQGLNTVERCIRKYKCGIFACDDNIASLLFIDMLKRGLEAGKEYLLCGFDNLISSMENEISSFKVDFTEIADNAFLIFDSISRDKRSRISKIHVDPLFIERKSSSLIFSQS